MKISGFSLIETLISLLLLSLGINFSAQWLLQSAQLHVMASQYSQLTLLGANIAERVTTHGSTDNVTADWDKQLKKIRKDAHLSISTQGMLTRIVIETSHPKMKIMQWVVVSG